MYIYINFVTLAGHIQVSNSVFRYVWPLLGYCTLTHDTNGNTSYSAFFWGGTLSSTKPMFC